jgi:hypothetical protein
MATQVEFTSYVDRKGYKIVPAKPTTLKPGQSILDIPSHDIQPARIVRNGGVRKTLRLHEYPMLYSDFANVNTSEKLLEFITKHGPLTDKNEIPRLLDAAADMRACLRGRKLPPWPIADLKASFSTEKGSGNAVIKFRPARLLDALWLQLGHSLSGGAKVRKCDRCDVWFPIGGKSGRRLVARFCSDKCRIEHNSLERTRKKSRR